MSKTWSEPPAERFAAQAEGKHSAPCARFCEANAFEIELRRLRSALKKANEQAEHFEREWYLRGDDIERLRSAIQQTLDENGHLADGEVCTLSLLKRALTPPSVG